MITEWITGIAAAAGGLFMATLGVGRMPLTQEERRVANSIAEGNGFRKADLRTLRLIHDWFGVDRDTVESAMSGIAQGYKNKMADAQRIQSASKRAIMSLREENDALRAAINAQGRLETIAMLKGMTVGERFQWERINHECPVDLHPDVGINSTGAVINPLTGRYL